MIPAEILRRIPGCSGGRPPQAVQPLPGGRGCNLVLRVDTSEGRFVFRQRQPPLDRPGSAAMTELRCQLAAAVEGIAPGMIDAAPDGSWLLMEFVDAPVWTESRLLSPAAVERVGTRLAQLHTLDVPAGVAPVDTVGIAAGYLQQLREHQPEQAESHLPLLSRVQELSQIMEGIAARAVLNHGDLQAGNMLGNEPMLVDWEYAQVVDPTYDIACLLIYYPRLEAQLGHLMASAGLSNPADHAVLTLQRERFACLNRLWNAVNGLKAG